MPLSCTRRCATLFARGAVMLSCLLETGAIPLNACEVQEKLQASKSAMFMLQTRRSILKVPIDEMSDPMLRFRRHGLNRDNKIEEIPTKHIVQHDPVLNKMGLWWLMAVAIACIGVVCIKMEASRKTESSRKADRGADKDPEEPVSASNICNGLFCVVALNVAMLFWGISQEYMMTNVYRDASGRREHLTNSFTLVFFNRCATVIFCVFLMWFQDNEIVMPRTYQAACPAITNLLASWCQYESLIYVSFPLLTVTKSAKLLPVLVLSSLRGYRHTLLDYSEALLVVSALVVFGFETDYSGDGTVEPSTNIGIMFLSCGLLADSITPHLQDRLLHGNEKMNVTQATFAMSVFAAGLSFLVLLATGDIIGTFAFFVRHPDAALHAFVLSMCSTMTQFLIMYTINYFGPVVFTVIATSRQMISVCLSVVLFHHAIPTLAWVAATVALGTIITRSVLSLRKQNCRTESNGNRNDVPSESGPLHDFRAETDFMPVPRFGARLLHSPTISTLLICAFGMCGPLALYSVSQEFMSIHTFGGDAFKYPMFLIAMNRFGGGVFALWVLYLQGIDVKNKRIMWSAIPAGFNLGATYCQYEALYFIRFPVQSLLKSLKIIPVMICGRVLKNRVYSLRDYMEGLGITVLVGIFSWGFDKDKQPLQGEGTSSSAATIHGFVLMLGYICCDSCTSNFEDILFQREKLDPGQMLLGMQAFSGISALVSMLVAGELLPAIEFMSAHREALLPLAVLVLSEACGCYACMITVKIFGPAVFTLLLMAHQIFGIFVSVALFNHGVNLLSCLCLGMVCMMILTSSVRRASHAEETGT